MNPNTAKQAKKPLLSPRVMAYSHDGVGLGHLRRTLNICDYISSAHSDASFLVVTGSPYISLFNHGPRVDFLKLPSLSKIDNETYRSRYLSLSRERLLHFRESLLLETARNFRPDVLLVDKAPVGVCGELMPTLLWLRRRRPETRIIFGMRDIEDDPAATIRQWNQLGVRVMFEEYYDEIWVYGMQSVFDVVREYQLSPGTRSKIRFMGYLTRRPCKHDVSSSRGVPQVLVTVGGGTDGGRVLETYLAEAAREMAANGVHSVVVAGPDLPHAEGRRLRDVASGIPSTEWIDFDPCMLCRIRQADLVVSMGGYNTLCEVALNRKPALVVPRTRPRMEQAMRAELWARRGVVEVVDPQELTPSTLARRVSTMLESGPKVTAPDLDLNGLGRVGDRFNAFWHDEGRHAAAVCMQ